ncbi:MAG: VTT domain-containing protein [Gemmataceae bacterium]
MLSKKRSPRQVCLHWIKIFLATYLVASVVAPPLLAYAQDDTAVEAKEEAAEGEDTNFVWDVLKQLFTLNTQGLMKVLSRPQYLIAAFITLNLIIFTETGLLVGFFLPGDSLLVLVGLICANPDAGWGWQFLVALMVSLSVSAIVGDTVGYSIGYKAGQKLFTREDSLFFHKNHLLKAQEFYDKHGGKTIIIARFVPIIRTFAPVVAGIGRMYYPRFVAYNVFGGIGWVVGMLAVGYFLPSALNPVLQPIFGEDFHVEKHVEKVIILVVFLSVLPMILAWAQNKFSGKKQAPELPSREDATTPSPTPAAASDQAAIKENASPIERSV